jgi:hypothetical protein
MPALPYVLIEGRGIPYNTDTKFLCVYINENVKWINHIRYVSSKLNTCLYIISSLKNVTSAHVLRTMYFACFHIHLRYGVTLWGGDPESIKIFQLQKKVVRIIGKVGQHSSCRNLFTDLYILPLPCLYISEVVCRVKSNWEQVKQKEIHDHYTCQKSDFHAQLCRTTVYKNSCENVGIKLFNKLPNTIKRVERTQESKRRLQHVLYSVDKYMFF